MSEPTMTQLEPTMTELKPCPWCVGGAIVVSDGRKWKVWHECQSIEGVEIDTGWHRHRADAIAAWNRRAES